MLAAALEPYAAEGTEPLLRFGTIDAFGAHITAVAFVRTDVFPAVAVDAMSRALASMPWLASAIP